MFCCFPLRNTQAVCHACGRRSNNAEQYAYTTRRSYIFRSDVRCSDAAPALPSDESQIGKPTFGSRRLQLVRPINGRGSPNARAPPCGGGCAPRRRSCATRGLVHWPLPAAAAATVEEARRWRRARHDVTRRPQARPKGSKQRRSAEVADRHCSEEREWSSMCTLAA